MLLLRDFIKDQERGRQSSELQSRPGNTRGSRVPDLPAWSEGSGFYGAIRAATGDLILWLPWS